MKTYWHLEQRTFLPLAGILDSSRLNFVKQEAHVMIIGLLQYQSAVIMMKGIGKIKNKIERVQESKSNSA
jgi:hypothetical protein